MIATILDMFLILVALASGIRLVGRLFTAMLSPDNN